VGRRSPMPRPSGRGVVRDVAVNGWL